MHTASAQDLDSKRNYGEDVKSKKFSKKWLNKIQITTRKNIKLLTVGP